MWHHNLSSNHGSFGRKTAIKEIDSLRFSGIEKWFYYYFYGVAWHIPYLIFITATMERYLKDLIAAGENQHLDFKYCISDSKKIARTLCAFANSDGGRLLIGVRDNGSIAGISSEEEFYMVQTAALLFCRPEVKYTTKDHRSAGKTILEIEVSKGDERPYRAMNDEGRWLPFFRNNDQNLVADRVMLEVWRKESKSGGVTIRFGKPENILMEYLKTNGSISLSGFRRIAGLPRRKCEAIISGLVHIKVLKMRVSEKEFRYELIQPAGTEELTVPITSRTNGKKV